MNRECLEVISQIDAYLDGELSPAWQEAIAAHLNACRKCRAELEAEQLVKEAVGRVQSERAPDRLQQRVVSQLGQVGWVRQVIVQQTVRIEFRDGNSPK